MKILVVSLIYPSQNNKINGSYVHNQLKELSKLENEIKVIFPKIYIPRFISKLLRRDSWIDEYNYQGIDVKNIKCYPYRFLFKNNLAINYKLFKLFIEKKLTNEIIKFDPEIVYCIDPLQNCKLSIEICNKLNIPVVSIIHSMPSGYLKLNKKNINYLKYMYEYSNKIIFVSKKQKMEFDSLFKFKENEKVIYNGFISENKKFIHHHLTNKLRITTIGFLEDQKGYQTIFSALKKIFEEKSFEFTIDIFGDGIKRSEYIETVKKYGISKFVKFNGIVEHSTIIKNLESADVFLLPAINESFGIVYLEAMSMCLPIIGTKGEPITEIVKNGINGFVIEKNNINELCKVLKYIYDNYNDIENIRRKAFECSNKFTWQKNAEKLNKIFLEIRDD